MQSEDPLSLLKAADQANITDVPAPFNFYKVILNEKKILHMEVPKPNPYNCFLFCYQEWN